MEQRFFWARIGPYTNLELYLNSVSQAAEGWLASSIGSDVLPHGTEFFLPRAAFALLRGQDGRWDFAYSDLEGKPYEPPIIYPGQVVIISGFSMGRFKGCELACKIPECSHARRNDLWSVGLPQTAWGLKSDAGKVV